MVYTIYGPTLIALEELFSTDTTTMGVAMGFNAAGILAGNILCGIIYDRFGLHQPHFICSIV